MSETLIWGATLRVVQALASAAPFILTGFIVAAVFRRLLGYKNTRELFGEGTWRSLPQAWLIGMLLPVCSLGVIPVMREMKRAGISGGTILAFGLTAPLFNPLSVLYGLTLSEPFTIFAFALASLAVVTAIGLIFDRIFPTSQEERDKIVEPAQVPYGIKRVLSVLVSICRDFLSRSSLYILFAMTGIVFLSVWLPAGSFQSQVNGDNPYAPLLMSTVAIPAYATPMLAMGQLGMIFQHGNSVGAAFTLLILGAGLNFGIVAWMYFNFGWKKSSVWLIILIGTVLGLSYGLEKPLYPTDVEPANHTHAFDVYCCPYHADAKGLAEETWNKIREDSRVEEQFAMIGLAIIGLIGVVISFVEKKFSLEDWLTAQPQVEEKPAGSFDLVLPNWVLGASALVGLIILSVAGCFAYYPETNETLEEITIVKGEVLAAANSGNKKHALHWLPIWEDWNRRLQVGVYLRKGGLSEYHRMKALVLRDQLEDLEHALEDNEKPENVRKLVASISRAQLRLSRAYRKEL